jgi:anti-sigma regulatory factor (Ser/Thr protein kinase)
LSSNSIKLHYEIPGYDLTIAGEASSSVKKMLNQLGVPAAVIKKATIAMYEAEINAVIHAGGGEADVEITPESIITTISDKGREYRMSLSP